MALFQIRRIFCPHKGTRRSHIAPKDTICLFYEVVYTLVSFSVSIHHFRPNFFEFLFDLCFLSAFESGVFLDEVIELPRLFLRCFKLLTIVLIHIPICFQSFPFFFLPFCPSNLGHELSSQRSVQFFVQLPVGIPCFAAICWSVRGRCFGRHGRCRFGRVEGCICRN